LFGVIIDVFSGLAESDLRVCVVEDTVAVAGVPIVPLLYDRRGKDEGHAP
jgi:hypothetical protein